MSSPRTALEGTHKKRGTVVTMLSLCCKKFAGCAVTAATLLTVGVTATPGFVNESTPGASDTATIQHPYYVDCSREANGDGSEASPLNSLAAANGITLQPGDGILFKAGTTCSAQVQDVDGQQVKAGLRVVNAKGTAEAPITIGTYGTGAAPVIAGNGVSETVLLKNSEYITVQGLEVTNTDSDSAQRGKYMRRGIVLMNDNAGVLHHITVTGNTIHDIYGAPEKDLGGSGGIQMETYGQSIPTVGPDKTKANVTSDASRPGKTVSYFDDVSITDNTLTNVQRSGINMSTDWRCREDVSWDCPAPHDANSWTPNKNVYIARNSLRHIGGDGIVIQMSDGAVVEGNYVYSAAEQASAGSNAAIWNWNADNTLFQYNEVANTQRASSNNDGTAWDYDYGTRNTVFQYNYSHDNAGGSLLVCNCSGPTAMTAGATFRYNLSINDGVASEPLDFNQDTHRSMFMANVTDMNFYNNTFIMPKTQSMQFSTNGGAASITFANNLIIAQGTVADENASLETPTRHMVYVNNVFVGSDDNAHNWPLGEASQGNQVVGLNKYLADSGLNLDAVSNGDLSSLNMVNPYTNGKGRAFASEGLPFELNNVHLNDGANTTKGFPTSFDSATHAYGQQNPVPSWSAPDVGAFQKADVNTGKPGIAELAGRSGTTVTVPGNRTIAITSTTPQGTQLGVSIDNQRGYMQTTDLTGGTSTLYVRTGSDTSSLRLDNLGDGTITGISFATVNDVMRDGSFESASSSNGSKKSASPWTMGSPDNTLNWDTNNGEKVAYNPRSSTTGVVSGAYAAELGTISDPFKNATINQRTLPAQPGKTYRIGLWATLGKSGDASPSKLQVTVKAHPAALGAGGSFSQYTKTVLNDSTTTADTTGGRVYYTGTFVVPLDVDPACALWVAIGQPNLTADATAAIDNVTLVQVESATSNVKSLAITTTPQRTVYGTNERLDETGLTVTATYTDGSARALTSGEYTTGTVDMSTPGLKHVPIMLNSDPNITATLYVRVIDNIATQATATASAIQHNYGDMPASNSNDGLLSTSWSNWDAGDTDAWLSYTFDTARQLGGVVMYPDAKNEAVPSRYTVQYQNSDGTWADTDLVGVPVGSSATADASSGTSRVSQSAQPSVFVDLSGIPATTGLKLRLTQTGNDGISPYPYSKVGEVIITDAIPAATALTITSGPAKTSYQVGEAFDGSGLALTVTFADNATIPLNADQYTVSGFDSSKAGTNTITVAYADNPNITAQFTVNITGDTPPTPPSSGDQTPGNPNIPPSDSTTKPESGDASGSKHTIPQAGSNVHSLMMAAAIVMIAGATMMLTRRARHDR